jgi:hypothetical protein
LVNEEKLRSYDDVGPFEVANFLAVVSERPRSLEKMEERKKTRENDRVGK